MIDLVTIVGASFHCEVCNMIVSLFITDAHRSLILPAILFCIFNCLKFVGGVSLEKKYFLSSETRNPSIPVLAVAAAINGESSGASISDANLSSLPSITNIKLSVCEKARTVTSVCTSGTLCTVSHAVGMEGAPFGSFVDYVLDGDGSPVLLMNEMSMHTINIKNAIDGGAVGGGAMVSLFTQISAGKGQDVSRCSVTGRIETVSDTADDMASIRMKYSISHSYADQVMDSPKFAFYRLVPEKIYFVGGFGVMAEWVPVEDYKMARADVLARETAEIVARLNRDHRDDLELLATHLLGIEDLEFVRLTGLDRLGMDVRVTKRVSRKKLITDEFRIGFRIPVISVEDAKSEVLKVFQEAWERGQGYKWEADEELPGSAIPILKFAEDSLGVK